MDGPVYGSIFRNLKFVHLKEPDEYVEFQSDLVVYHDDVGDYATNEPTMDGTASLIYFLSAMEKEGKLQKTTLPKVRFRNHSSLTQTQSRINIK